MSERRALITLLLLAAAAAIYIWAWPAAPAQQAPVSQEKADAEERAKANPFPQ